MNQTDPREWIKKADEDLLTANILLKDPESPHRSIAYSSQQAVEKYLKAYLSALPDFRIPRSHDLGLLLDLCFNNGLSKNNINIEEVVSLTYFAIEARYPGEEDSVSREEAEESYLLAESIQNIIKIYFSK